MKRRLATLAAAGGVLASLAMAPSAQATEQLTVIPVQTYQEAWDWCWHNTDHGSTSYVDCLNAAAEAFYGVNVYWKA